MTICQLCNQEVADKILNGKVIALDVGHGYNTTAIFDIGAVGNERKEYDLNLAVATKTSEHLKALGAVVHIFENKDPAIRLSLAEKGARAGQVKADIFVSIHHNAADDARAQGTETFVHSQAIEEDIKLAKLIQKRLVETLKYHDRGIKHKQLGVLKGCPISIPACLTEGYFITWQGFNGLIPNELTDAYGLGLAVGIRDYLIQA